MRFVPTILPANTTPTTREIKSLSGVHAVKPIHHHEQEVEPENKYVTHAPPEGLPQQDRRKACRRIHQQNVLIELRSGLDRRRHNLMQTGVNDHIDEEA